MKILKSKLFIAIFLVTSALIYISITSGKTLIYVDQVGTSYDRENTMKLNDFLELRPDHFAAKDLTTIGSNTYLFARKYFKIDSLSISMVAIVNGNEILLPQLNQKITDTNELQFDSQGNVKESSYFKTPQIEVYPYNRIEITSWYDTKGIETDEFVIKYFIKTKNRGIASGSSRICRKSKFKIVGQHHYDITPVLYYFLWGILLILLLILAIKILRNKQVSFQ